mgnify:CR=1 FL=1
MGEKETMADSGAKSGTLNVSASPGGSVSAAQGDQDGEVSSAAAEKSVQWEPHKAPGLNAPDEDADGQSNIQGAGSRHDTLKNSIGNIR